MVLLVAGNVERGAKMADWSHGAQSIAYSPDGSKLAVGGLNEIKIRNASTGELLDTFAAQGEIFSDLSFTSDGAQLVSASTAKNGIRLRIWNLITHVEIDSPIASGNCVFAAKTSEESHVAIVTDCGFSSLSLANNKLSIASSVVPVKGCEIQAACITPDASTVAYITNDQKLQWADTKTGRILVQMPCPVGVIPVLAVSKDGSLIARSVQPNVEIFDLESGKKNRQLEVDRHQVFGMDFSPDHKHLVTVAPSYADRKKSEAIIWDWQKQQAIHSLSDPNLGRQVIYSPDGNSIALLGNVAGAPVVRVCAPNGSGVVPQIAGHQGEAWSVAFTPDGRYLATGGDDHKVRIWDMLTGRWVSDLTHPALVRCLSFSKDGRHLVTGCDDSHVRLWDVATHSTLWMSSGQGAKVRCLSFSSDGKRLATSGNSKLIRVLDAVNGKELNRIEGPSDIVHSILYSLDDNQIYAADDAGCLWIWESGSLNRKILLENEPTIFKIVMAPDGKVIATAHRDGSIWLRDAPSGEKRLTLNKHREQVYALAFSHDGRTSPALARTT